MKWDEWRGSLDGRPVFYSRKLFEIFGVRFSIHKMVGPDDCGCFHTHPANAIRIVIWGGYEEQIFYDFGSHIKLHIEKCGVGTIGLVRPQFCHRIKKISNNKSSYSLWIRFKKTAQVHLRGEGWAKQASGKRESDGKIKGLH